MGASESTGNTGKVLNTKPPPSLPPEPPYHGPNAQYHFINTDVVIGGEFAISFTTTPMMTSNIDSYYPLLAAQYGEGFRLLSFYRIPGQVSQAGFMKMSFGFQGIFCRYPQAPRRDQWQLRVEKSSIQLHQVYTGLISMTQGGTVVSNTSHLIESIARNTQNGGRLICIELTGEEQRATMGMAMHGISPLMGVDLFFEVPASPGGSPPQQYVYNVVSVPISVTVKMGMRPVPEVHCDWIGTLANHLNQGWRLIEIFMDKTEYSRRHGFSGISTMNSMWFFEKPASHLNNMSPLYEGTVIDHQVKVKQSFGGSRTSANWETVIQSMGNRGWELACILETPEVVVTGLTTVYMTCKMFFQRPILPATQPAPPAYGAADAGGVPSAPPPPFPPSSSTPSGLPPPPYDLVMGGMWGSGSGSGGGEKGGVGVVGGGGGGGWGDSSSASAPSAQPSVGEKGGSDDQNPSSSSAPPPIGFEGAATSSSPPPPNPDELGY